MSIDINESGMCFGPFDETDLFHIEKSNVYKSLGQSIRTVEFILHKNNCEIIFIEAKSSSPRPNNPISFDDFITEVYDKFVHSMDMYFSIILNRLNDKNNEMPKVFKSIDYSKIKLKLFLIINGHPVEWLPPVFNSLKMKLKRQIKIWGVELSVMNQYDAAKYGLLNAIKIS